MRGRGVRLLAYLLPNFIPDVKRTPGPPIVSRPERKGAGHTDPAAHPTAEGQCRSCLRETQRPIIAPKRRATRLATFWKVYASSSSSSRVGHPLCQSPYCAQPPLVAARTWTCRLSHLRGLCTQEHLSRACKKCLHTPLVRLVRDTLCQSVLRGPFPQPEWGRSMLAPARGLNCARSCSQLLPHCVGCFRASLRIVTASRCFCG